MKQRETGRILSTGSDARSDRELSKLVSALGFELDAVAAGDSFVECVREGRFELVVLGEELEPAAADALCHRIRLEPQTRHTPVLKLTDPSALENTVSRGAVNADDVLVSPFGQAELLLRIRNLMRLRALHEELAQKIRELEGARNWLVELAHTDSLTSLYNRRYLEEFTNREVRRARRFDRKLSVVMIDVDHFKVVNDTYGHATGDRLLRTLGLMLRECVRNVDLPARYGGEEFALVLPETDKDGATLVAERVRARVESHDFGVHRANDRSPITLSAGIATFPCDGPRVEPLFQVADRRLYRAKAAGRNRVIGIDAPAPETV